LRKWVLELHSRKLKVPKAVVQHLDQVEKLILDAESSQD
jgi:hypothetical protein